MSAALPIPSAVAGRPEFVELLRSVVRAQTGSDPRIASGPRDAAAACSDGGGVVVMQYGGQEWLPVIREVRARWGSAIAVVVALGRDHAAEVATVRSAGADAVVPWDGNPDAVGWLVAQVLEERRRGGERDAGPAGAADDPTAHAQIPARPAADGQVPARPAAADARPPVWPATVPGNGEASRAIAAALADAAGEGLSGPGPIARAARALADLGPKLGGGEAPGRAVVQRAVALWLRVSLACATAPARGGALDPGAAEALLVEVDGVLPELTALEGAAPPDARPALEALRADLVREAIDLTEAVQRLRPPVESAPAAAPAAARAGPAPAVRVLSNLRAEPGRSLPRPVRAGSLVALALAAAAAAAFHLHAALTRSPAPEARSLSGAPRGTVAVREGSVGFVVTEAGKPLDRAEVDRFATQEELRGNVVKEVAPGVLVSLPAPAAGGVKP